MLWEDATYSDKRALLFMPKGFDVRRPGVIVVFLHGNRATLERDVGGRQRVAAQIAEANVNAVLVAPQLAVNANNSSAGRFWESYGFARFIGEAGAHLARLHGDKRTRKTFATLPVVIVAYSGGYVPAAWALHKGGSDSRVIGVLLLDALYGEVDKYADFIKPHPSAFFVSAYTSSSARGNESLQKRPVPTETSISTPACPLRLQGKVAFLRTTGADHEDFVTRAWIEDPDPRRAGADRRLRARPSRQAGAGPARRRAVSAAAGARGRPSTLRARSDAWPQRSSNWPSPVCVSACERDKLSGKGPLSEAGASGRRVPWQSTVGSCSSSQAWRCSCRAVPWRKRPRPTARP